MTNLFIIYYLIGCFDNLILASTFISCLALIAFGIAWPMRWDWENSFEVDLILADKFKKIFMRMIPVCVVLIFLTIFFPSKKTIIAFYTFNKLDQYNIENVESNLKTENMLELIDITLGKVKKVLNSNEE